MKIKISGMIFELKTKVFAFLTEPQFFMSRDLEDVQCPGGQVHIERGSACPETCENVGYARECDDSLWVDGCFCPKGRYLYFQTLRIANIEVEAT